MNNAVWFMGGAIACIAFLLILVTVMNVAEEVSRKRFERIINEYEDKLEQQKEDNAEHTRKCLAEQKEQIEAVGRKAREYQSARFEEERVRLANENFDSGREQGRKEMIEKLRKGVQSGEIVINRSVDKH